MGGRSITGLLQRAGLINRGEVWIAPAGACVAVLLVVAVVSAAAWGVHTSTQQADRERQAGAVSSARLLAMQLAEAIGRGERSAARRLVMDTATWFEFSSSRLVLGDGRVLAAEDAGMAAWPESWPEFPHAERVTGRDLLVHVDVPEFGRAGLEIQTSPVRLQRSIEQTVLGVGVALVLALGVFVIVYRTLCGRVLSMGLLSDAVIAAGAGEPDLEALKLHPKFGAGAQAWNRVIAQLEDRDEAVLRASAGSAGSGEEPDGGLHRRVCDSWWQGLMILGEGGEVRYTNGAAAVLLGQDRATLSAARLADAIADEGVSRAVDAVLSGVQRARSTHEIMRGAGEEEGVLRVSIRGVEFEGEPAAVVVIEDVTQQRVADEARNTFVAQATHELRTPLTNILLYVEEALEDGEDDVQVRARALNVINQEARRLERVVGDMLSVSEIEAGSMKLHVGDVRLDAMLADIERDHSASAQERDIDLVFELPPRLPVVQGDRDKLSATIHNLIGNALKYTPQGGRVTVRFAEGEGECVLEVIDNGIGISDEDQDRIFERFYRAKDMRLKTITGSGLGLALAREVARLHGGDVAVQSELNKGSTFSLSLPAAKAA